QLAAADYFSIESTSATRKFVSRLHNEGKQVYVWTVNREYTIKKMIERNVDNIITDDIILARKCIDESRYSDLLSEFMKLLIQ
ncbi:MAG: glycerophosphodiester phosphodiesterase, partial [Firmicutes bacterium]|nr:glycerophosphodiester phosphodiesterase [Bacillota bacterium]